MGQWLRREVAAARGLLDGCRADLDDALSASAHLSTLATSWQVCNPAYILHMSQWDSP